MLLLLLGIPQNPEFERFIDNFKLLTDSIEEEIKKSNSNELNSSYNEFKLLLNEQLTLAPYIQDVNVPYFNILEREIKYANRLLDYFNIGSLSKKVFDIFKTALSSIIEFSGETLSLLWKLMDEMVDLGRLFEKS